MSGKETSDERHERLAREGAESWHRMAQDAKALGAFGKIELIGHVENGALVRIEEAPRKFRR